MLKGGYVADLPIALAAIDPCMSCTDRIALVDIGKRKKWVGSTDQLRRHIKKCHGK
jgi:membrane-bound hydrogenase subunit alpha